MKYKQSSIFSNNEKIDCRNLCLYFNFKDEKTEDIIKLINLIDINLIQKFEDDFVFDIQFNEEDITCKALHKKIKTVGEVLSKNISLIYDAILKTDKISTRSEYREFVTSKVFMQNWDLEELELKYDLNNIDSIRYYIESNINNEDINYMSMPTPQDIGLNFNCEYVKQTDENSDFGYYGSLSFNISGHILDYKFDDFINYLNQFIKESSKILKSLCANIFISEKNLKPDYYNLFEMENINDISQYENSDDYINNKLYGYLNGVEGINFIPKALFSKIDKNLLKDDIFEIKEEANGVFININKDLDKINIHDKYKVRDILNSILIKGYSEHDLVHFMQFLGRVPVYMDEIILVESLEEKIRQDIYNKYFVITKNQEIEDLKLDSEKFRLHKFNCA